MDAVNLFTVDVATGVATFAASARTESDGIPLLAVGRGYFAWTENACDPDEERSLVFDVATRTLTQLDQPLRFSDWNGSELAVGLFGFVHALIDRHTLEYVTVFPGRDSLGPLTSRDGRWAVSFPHKPFGALCP